VENATQNFGGKNKRKGNPSFKIENFFQFLFLCGEKKMVPRENYCNSVQLGFYLERYLK